MEVIAKPSKEESNTLLLTERHNLIYIESLCLLIHEMMAVAKEYLPLNAPVVVYKVGIIKINAPTLTLWRKTAQKQHFGMFWQKRHQWMILYSTRAPCYILSIQIRFHVQLKKICLSRPVLLSV